MRRQVAGSLVLTAFLIACATAPQAQLSQAERHSERALLELAKRTDADSLAAAGPLTSRHLVCGTHDSDPKGTGARCDFQGSRDRSRAWFDRAVAAGPARPELVWLQAQNCLAAPACDPEPLERRLRELRFRRTASLPMHARVSGCNASRLPKCVGASRRPSSRVIRT